MTCDCCGGKKKLFEIFYSEKEGSEKIRFCPDCWDVVERLKSDQASGERELYGIHQLQLRKRAKNPTEAFLTWKQENFPE